MAFKCGKAHGKATQKSDLPWSVIFSVIVYLYAHTRCVNSALVDLLTLTFRRTKTMGKLGLAECHVKISHDGHCFEIKFASSELKFSILCTVYLAPAWELNNS